MKPLAFILFGSFLLSCGGDGGVSSTGIPQGEACNQAATTFCQKIYGCQDATSKAVQVVLMSETACEATILQNCGSTAFYCGAGMTYHPEQALVCKNDFAGQSCDKLGAAIAASLSVTPISMSAVIAAITANVPSCTTICSTP